MKQYQEKQGCTCPEHEDMKECAKDNECEVVRRTAVTEIIDVLFEMRDNFNKNNAKKSVQVYLNPHGLPVRLEICGQGFILFPESEAS